MKLGRSQLLLQRAAGDRVLLLLVMLLGVEDQLLLKHLLLEFGNIRFGCR